MEQDLTNNTLSPEDQIIEEETSIANQVIDLIQKKYDLIENYNNFKSVLLAQNNDELTSLIDEIIASETSIIGILTGILANTQPDIESVENV